MYFTYFNHLISEKIIIIVLNNMITYYMITMNITSAYLNISSAYLNKENIYKIINKNV